MLREALRGRYGHRRVQAWRSPRLPASANNSAAVVEYYIAGLWDLVVPPIRQCPGERHLVLSGWVPGMYAGAEGHLVGLTHGGTVVCSRQGSVAMGSVGGAAVEVLRRIPNVDEVCYFVLPAAGVEGGWQGSEPLAPSARCWGWEPGRRRVYVMARTANQDWGTPVRGFVDEACSCPALP